MFLLSLMSLSLASDPDFTNIEKGEPAPFAGKLLTNEALAEIISNHESDIMQSDLDKEFELQKQRDELDLRFNLQKTECDANILMYQGMIDVRDQEIKKQARRDWIQRAAFFGGFALGVGSTIAIVKAVE